MPWGAKGWKLLLWKCAKPIAREGMEIAAVEMRETDRDEQDQHRDLGNHQRCIGARGFLRAAQKQQGAEQDEDGGG